MKFPFLSYVKYFLLLALTLILDVGAALAKNSDQAYVRLAGHIPPMQISSTPVLLGALNADQPISVTFILPLRNQEALEEIVKRIHDPADKQHYGKYFTTEEFTERFAPLEEDYDKVIAYAKELGLNISGIHPNRTLLNVIGQRTSIESGFNINLQQYQLRDGRKFYAPDDNPEVPVSIASILNGIVGLDSLAVWHPYNRRKQKSKALFDSNAVSHSFPSGPGGGFAPNDLAIAYNLAEVPADGSGQTIAIFALAGYHKSDINEYTNHFGLPPPKLKNILVDGGSGIEIHAEVTLDIELAIALAPESQIYIYEGPNSAQGVLDTYNRIATDNHAKQVSSSWGLGEDLVGSQFLQAENAIFLQMAAHGQTIYAAAGDNGAYDNYPYNNSLSVDDPASQPYVVGVGGTTLNINPQTGTYESETVWNNGFGNGAGGGGVSKFWTIPSWQKNVPTVNSKSKRNIPDVSLNADPNTGYSIYHAGQWEIYGGTSCAAPLWAAFTARVNQQLALNQKPVLGFANPLLYAIGEGESSATDFHDIISGTNLYYGAQANYDNATGWGSFNGANLLASFTNSLPIPFPPALLWPVLDTKMKQQSLFKRGKIGVYNIKISNSGNESTSGSIQVAMTLPNGLIYKGFHGSGWVKMGNSLTFRNKSILKPGANYPPLKIKVKVGMNAPSSVVSSATVSGGAAASSSVTNQTTIIDNRHTKRRKKFDLARSFD